MFRGCCIVPAIGHEAKRQVLEPYPLSPDFIQFSKIFIKNHNIPRKSFILYITPSNQYVHLAQVTMNNCVRNIFLIVRSNYYCPQTKFGEGNDFTGVCLFTWGRGW